MDTSTREMQISSDVQSIMQTITIDNVPYWGGYIIYAITYVLLQK